MNSIKKVSSLILAIFLVIGLLPLTIFATSVTTNLPSGNRGDTVTIDITISESDNVRGAAFAFTYSDDIFTFSSFELTATGAFAGNYDTTNKTVAGFAISPFNPNGTLGKLTLKINNDSAFGEATIGYTVTLTSIDNKNQAYNGTTTVTVVCPHTNTNNTAAENPTCTKVGYTAGVYCNDCQKYISGHTEIAKVAHTYGNTWTSNGEDTHSRVCTVCGLDESKQTENHTWNNGEVTTQPTHTTFGVKTYTCTKCNATKTEQIAKTTGHTYTNWTKLNDTQHTGTCACGETLTENHTWNNGEVTTQPTHTTFGVKTYTCTKCNATKTEQIAKTTGHTFTNWTKLNDTQHTGTCACGETQTENHTWNNGVVTTTPTCVSTGIKTYTCTKCNATKEETLEIDNTNHVNKINVAAVPATCSSVGYTAGVYCNDCQKYISGHAEIAKLAHTYENVWTSDGENTHSRVCKVCGLDESKQTENHTWNNGEVTTQPTHTTFGVKTYTCTKCNATKTEQIAKTTGHTYTNWTKLNDAQHTGTCACGETLTENHTWNNGVVTTTPTCSSTGIKTYTCTKCNATKEETLEIDNTNHVNTINVAAVPVTCSNVGYTAGVYCNDCQKYISGHIEIEKLAHTYGNVWTSDGETTHSRVCTVCGLDESKQTNNHAWDKGIITKQASHVEKGIKTYTCTICNATKTEEIEKTTGHGFNNWTKLNDTQHTGTCACGETLTENHTWNNGVVTTAPTCVSTGIKTYTCTKCNATKEETLEIDNTNHVNKINVAAVPATCSSVGYTAGVYCNDCQKYISGHAEITKLAHTYENVWTSDGENTHSRVCKVCGLDESKQTENHSFGNWTKTNDTQHSRQCVCGKTETANHTWDDGVVTTQPTHTAFGVKTYTCTACNATKTEDVAKTTEHTFTNWSKLNDTQHKGTCACGETLTENHTWNNGEVTTQPTHTVEGVKTYTCTKCSATKTEKINKLTAHEFGAWTKFDDNQHIRTCACGESEKANHTWNNGVVTTQATHIGEGVRTYTCTVCGATKTEKIDKTTEHTFSNWTKVDDDQHKGTCACGETLTENHTWDGGKITTVATHTSEGVKTYTCTKCNATRTESIDKIKAHTFGRWTNLNSAQHVRKCECGEVEKGNHEWQFVKVVTEATCASEGKELYTCRVCGTSNYVTTKKTENHTFDNDCDPDCNVCGLIRNVSHTPAKTYSKDATSHWFECTKCHIRLQVAAHTPGSAATETSPQVCTECGYILVPAIGHKHNFESTWTTDENSHWHKCNGCEEVSNKANHLFDKGKVTKEATETSTGVFTYTCSVCGYTKTEVIPVVPKMTLPENDEWKPENKEGITFKSSAELKDFISVEVDGRAVPRQYYDLTEGSTIVTLHSDYLETLVSGRHAISIKSKTGTAKAEFTVTNPKRPAGSDVVDPTTPTTNTWTFVIIGVIVAVVIAGVGIVVAVIVKKGKKRD